MARLFDQGPRRIGKRGQPRRRIILKKKIDIEGVSYERSYHATKGWRLVRTSTR